MFKDIVKICMKKAYDNRIRIDSKNTKYKDTLRNHMLNVQI